MSIFCRCGNRSSSVRFSPKVWTATGLDCSRIKGVLRVKLQSDNLGPPDSHNSSNINGNNSNSSNNSNRIYSYYYYYYYYYYYSNHNNCKNTIFKAAALARCPQPGGLLKGPGCPAIRNLEPFGGFPKLGGSIGIYRDIAPPKMENQMDNKMENEMETGVI